MTTIGVQNQVRKGCWEQSLGQDLEVLLLPPFSPYSLLHRVRSLEPSLTSSALCPWQGPVEQRAEEDEAGTFPRASSLLCHSRLPGGQRACQASRPTAMQFGYE